VGPRAGLDAVVKRKIPSPRRESNSRTSIVQLIAQSNVLFEKLIDTQLVKELPTFSKPEGSLPCSQKPTTGLYTQMNLVHNFPPYFSKINCNITLPPTLSWSRGSSVSRVTRLRA
jgi:hypothetical protein